MTGLSYVESRSVDLVIADPPYGIEKNFGQPDSWTTIEEWVDWCWDWLSECNRILKDGGSILLYGIHANICHNQVQLYELGLSYRRQIIWHYENGFCGHKNLRATYEPLLWFTKGDDYFYTPIREPYKSSERLKYPVKKNGKVWMPNPDGRLAGDVWDIPTLAGRRFRDEKVDHPTQKPLAISERLAKHFCPDNGFMVIPFAGSGSECVAAYRNGRRFLGFEINPKYQALALNRLCQEGWNPTSSHPIGIERDQIAIVG